MFMQNGEEGCKCCFWSGRPIVSPGSGWPGWWAERDRGSSFEMAPLFSSFLSSSRTHRAPIEAPLRHSLVSLPTPLEEEEEERSKNGVRRVRKKKEKDREGTH